MHKLRSWIAPGGLLLALLVGLALRLPGMLTLPLWFDEADTWTSAVAQYGITYDRFVRWTNHFENAPLGYAVARLSTDVFHSQEPWALRLPALAFGLGCIVLAYGLGKTIQGSALGLILAWLVCLDPVMVDQSLQCRMYPLLAFWNLLALVLAIRLLRNPQRSMWEWLGLGAALGLCLWSTLLGVMAWVSLVIAVGLLLAGGWVMHKPHRQARAVITGAFFALIVAGLTAQVGVYSIIWRYLYGPDRGSRHMPLTPILREIVINFKDWFSPHSALGLVVPVLALAGLWLLSRRCKTSTVVMLGWLAGTLIMTIPFRRAHRFMDPRYFTTLQPVVWVGLAMWAVPWLEKYLAPASVPMSAQAPTTPMPAPVSAAPIRPWGNRAKMLGMVALLGWLAWDSTHLTAWRSQPDRYLLARAIARVRDLRQPGEAAVVAPPVAFILADYYHLKLDPTLDQSLGQDYQPVADPHVPATYDAPGTWLVLGMVNVDTRFDPQDRFYVGKPVRALAEHYQVQVSEDELRTHIQRDRVTIAHFRGGSVEWETLSPFP